MEESRGVRLSILIAWRERGRSKELNAVARDWKRCIAMIVSSIASRALHSKQQQEVDMTRVPLDE